MISQEDTSTFVAWAYQDSLNSQKGIDIKEGALLKCFITLKFIYLMIDWLKVHTNVGLLNTNSTDLKI